MVKRNVHRSKRQNTNKRLVIDTLVIEAIDCSLIFERAMIYNKINERLKYDVARSVVTKARVD